jgi:hypothetical protein
MHSQQRFRNCQWSCFYFFNGGINLVRFKTRPWIRCGHVVSIGFPHSKSTSPHEPTLHSIDVGIARFTLKPTLNLLLQDFLVISIDYVVSRRKEGRNEACPSSSFESSLLSFTYALRAPRVSSQPPRYTN